MYTRYLKIKFNNLLIKNLHKLKLCMPQWLKCTEEWCLLHNWLSLVQINMYVYFCSCITQIVHVFHFYLRNRLWVFSYMVSAEINTDVENHIIMYIVTPYVVYVKILVLETYVCKELFTFKHCALMKFGKTKIRIVWNWWL